MTSGAAHGIVAIVPCNDLDLSVAFYRKLGLELVSDWGGYKILGDGRGWHLHLTGAPEGWVVPERNPFGIYVYARDVDAVAERVRGDWIGGRGPERKPWGTYEFAVSDPNGILVRVGRSA